jgi:molybdopterin-guanine dinucleotide biosynthesis protein A
MAAHEGLIGYILAGGRSSRMGTDKALLTLTGEQGSKTFLAHAVETLRSVASDVVLLGSREDLQGADRALPDLRPAKGPLGGIETALSDLSAHKAEWACFLPVDMPLLPPGLYAALIAHWLARATEVLRIGMVQVDDRPQPLVSLIHLSLLPVISQALDQGLHKVTHVLKNAAESFAPPTSPGVASGSNVLEVISFVTESPASELILGTSNLRLKWNPSPQEETLRHLWFNNLNTPEDLNAARDFFVQTGS